ncbi:MAG TPA: DMT family transporter [Ramlibacter sp.]|uniref:DMT family transporter n=1 Tax=Ramlibacter sp. TaxID=1917967 RepID=UPI002B5763FE|nr:DMT family transporter [Ramlibacter sp.]HVZ44419.1 DMT family transporter [Ramlibacter sp.]
MNEQTQPTLLRAMPAVFVLIWSTGFIVARFGMPHAPPLKFLTLRYVCSVLCFGLWVILARVALPRPRSQWLHLAVTGILMHAGYLGGVWAAVKSGMGAGLAALLVGLQPVLTALWIAARGHAVGLRQWGGLALGLAGLVLVVWQKLGHGEVTAFNVALATGALVSITVGTLYQKRFVQACDVRSASLVQLSAAFAVTAPLACFETESVRWTGELAGALAWSVVALTLGGSSLLYLLIQRGAATAVTSLLYLVPPCTALMAWILFGEPITAFTVAGMALAAIGVSLVVRSRA